MNDPEKSAADIFDLIPKDLQETTVREKVGNVVLVLVDPEKVVRLIEALQVKGVNQIRYHKNIRILDPQLAKSYAQAAREILLYTIGALKQQSVSINTAINYGSSITGLVAPESDIDIQLECPDMPSKEAAGRMLRFDKRFREKLWEIPKIQIPSVSYFLWIPSMYQECPVEKWIPQAHDSVVLFCIAKSGLA